MIAKHVLDTPSSATQSVRDLARYLIIPARDDIQKAWHIYTWIANFISYDVEGYYTGSYLHSDVSPEGVLRQKKTVCSGYANLFQALTRASGLESEVVSGYAKGCGFMEEEILKGQSNHAWNIVKINGKWELIDNTWGAGHIDEHHNFVRSLNEFFFMSPPKELIYSHFPKEESWQFLNPPICKTRFASTVRLSVSFFNCRLRLGSHDQAVIRVKNETYITIFVPEDVELLTELRNGGIVIDKSNINIIHKKSNCCIHVKVPKPGKYELLIFAKKISDISSSYHHALSYVINAI